jgi:hypothetical protein
VKDFTGFETQKPPLDFNVFISRFANLLQNIFWVVVRGWGGTLKILQPYM